MLPVFLALGVVAIAGMFSTSCNSSEKDEKPTVRPQSEPLAPEFQLSPEPPVRFAPRLAPSVLRPSTLLYDSLSLDGKLAKLSRSFNFRDTEPSVEALAELRKSAADPKKFMQSPEYSAFLEKSLVGTDNFLKTLIEQTAQLLKESSKGTRFVIEGHTSGPGRSEANTELTQRWGEAVRILMEMHGVPVETMRSVGYGEKRPVAPEIGSLEAIEIAMARNRRIEIKVENK